MKYIVKVKQQLLSVTETAWYYNIPKERLYWAVKSGKISSQKMGTRYMIQERAIKRYLEKYEGRVV